MKKVVRLDKKKINTWEDSLKGFLFWKQAQGISQTTLNDYQCHVRMFFKRFSDSWENQLFRESVLEYMSDNIKPATYNLRLVYLRAFFQWCMEEGFIEKNPLQGFKRRKAPGRIVDISEDALKGLLKLPDQNTFVGLRDYALTLLTLDTGIRPGEAFKLKIKDFHFKQFLVTVPQEVAKTRIERNLPILAPTAEIIKKLINVRFDSWGDNTPIFCTNEGRQMTKGVWDERMKFYSEKLGFKIRPYDLRHSFALLYLRNGGHAFGLQKTLGHSDMQMTKRYINLTGQDLKEQHNLASPINKLVITKNRMGKLEG